MLIQEHVPLAPLTTLGVGGPARYFCEATSEDDVREAAVFAREQGLPPFVMGGGSNLVIADAGFPGLVLKIGLRGVQQESLANGSVRFDVAAGEDWDTFVAKTIAAGCGGIECLSGIPGTVGGTPVQNVGAYGQEVAQTIAEVRGIHLPSLEKVTFRNQDCRFGYRSSRFNGDDRAEYVITAVTFTIPGNHKPTLRYTELQKYFADRSSEPSLAEVRQAVLEIRRSKAMLIVPGDEDARSAGSFFKNPVVAEDTCSALAEQLAAKGLQMPSFQAGAGYRKLHAAWLVEHAGFAKGYSKGRAGISRRHALAVVNRGGATAAEIIALKNAIQLQVWEAFGIKLHPEPVFVGSEVT